MQTSYRTSRQETKTYTKNEREHRNHSRESKDTTINQNREQHWKNPKCEPQKKRQFITSKKCQNCRASYFFSSKSTYIYCKRSQNGHTYNALQSWHIQNRKLTNNIQYSDRLTFSTVQFLIKLAIRKIPNWPFLAGSVSAKLAHRLFKIPVVDTRNPCSSVIYTIAMIISPWRGLN